MWALGTFSWKLYGIFGLKLVVEFRWFLRLSSVYFVDCDLE